jgi:tryptophan-rich sensory protein
MKFYWPWIKKPKTNWLLLIGSISLAEFTGVVGSIFTINSLSNWYIYLNKPLFTPPNWIFGPVWTLLYACLGIAAYLVYQQGSKSYSARHFYQLYYIQLLLNIGWPLVFFGFKELWFALTVIIFLWTFIFQMIRACSELKLKSAVYLLLPYLAWVTFATALNISIIYLN